MTNEEHIFDGYVGSATASVSTAKDLSYVKFEAREGFKKTLTKDLKIADGRTLGQAHRDWLHAKLDEWIEENLKDKK
jgi:hypothetical protein